MNTVPELQVLEEYDYEVLPDGVFLSDEATFYDRFVGGFPESTTRKGVYRGFERLRSESSGKGISATQWIDGSFVESKLNPGDVDVVTFCDYDELNALKDENQRFVAKCLAGGETTKVLYKTHTFLVASCSDLHEYYPVFEACRAYWRTWFGTTRRTCQRKGMIEMAVGDATRAPRISHTRVDV